MLTIEQMEAILLARSIQQDAVIERQTIDQALKAYVWLVSGEALVAFKKNLPGYTKMYETGAKLLEQYHLTISGRITVYPTKLAADQTVIDSGYLATSPAYRIVTFTPKNP